jgi:hypothetical protein
MHVTGPTLQSWTWDQVRRNLSQRDSSMQTPLLSPIALLATGAGLLSILAARAAAEAGISATIYAIERVPSLAQLARDSWRDNCAWIPSNIDLRVLQADSTEVAVARNASPSSDKGASDGCDGTSINSPSLTIAAHAHVIVSEIFGDDPLSEGVLRSLRHATAHLLDRACGWLIPSHVSVHCALAALPPEVDRVALLDEAMAPLYEGQLGLLAPARAGVDLRSLCAASAWEPSDGANTASDHAILSEAVDLCTLSLREPLAEVGADQALLCGSLDAALLPHAHGRVPTAVVSWFSLVMCDGVRLASSPVSSTHWRQVAHMLPATQRIPIPIRADDGNTASAEVELAEVAQTSLEMGGSESEPGLVARLHYSIQDEETTVGLTAVVVC